MMWHKCPGCGLEFSEAQEPLGWPRIDRYIAPLPKIDRYVEPLKIDRYVEPLKIDRYVEPLKIDRYVEPLKIDPYVEPLFKADPLPKIDPMYDDRNRFPIAGPGLRLGPPGGMTW